MEYRRLGSAGLKLSALSLGSWISFGVKTGRQDVRECLAIAYDHGVNFFDGAEVYAFGEAERLMGEALADLGWPRDSYCLSGKVMFGAVRDARPTQRGLSRKHLVEGCEQTLRRFRVEHLDLFFCHRPDPETPVGEIVWTMHNLIQQGKILYWGTSEWPAEQIAAAMDFARDHNLIGPQMEQSQYNLLHRERVERELAGLIDGQGLGITAWSPLALGLLTGKYNDGIPEGSRLALPQYAYLIDMLIGGETGLRQRIESVKRLNAVADAAGMPLATMALAWCLRSPRIATIILGVSNSRQLIENLEATHQADRLDEATMAAIDAALATPA